jgi:predicted Fe-Mo cluster-binding NifX family protein
VLTGDCGPNAYRTLEAADVRVITGVDGNVADAVRRYRAGEFSQSGGPSVESHAGMNPDTPNA